MILNSNLGAIDIKQRNLSKTWRLTEFKIRDFIIVIRPFYIAKIFT